MAKVGKRDLILNSIIKAYLSENTPIGSSELGSRMEVLMPASTIRVYFKKLSDEGEITQLHISGGRIPTCSAMKRYWQQVFSGIDFGEILFDINDDLALKVLCDKFELYAMIFGNFDQELIQVTNVNDRFLLLIFSKDELVLKYNSRVERFLQNLIGVSLNKLELVCAQVGLSELKSKIRELKRAKIFFQANEILAFKMFENERYKMILEPSFASQMSDGINYEPTFGEEFMGLKLHIRYQGINSVMLCAGGVYSDYAKFLNKVREVA